MLFMALCRDKVGHTQTRSDNRADHLAWLNSMNGTIRIAGPFLADDGETMAGSLLILEADDLQAARTLLAADPYAKVELFQSVDVHPWRWVVGAPT